MTRRLKWIPSLTFMLVLCASGVAVASGSAGALFTEGNALYRQGAFEEAAVRYQAALATGLRNPDLYYNLGNAHFKRGALGEALLNYERALRLSPDDPDIVENIAFANVSKVDRFDLDPPNAATRFVLAFYHWFSPNGLSIWVSLTFLIACVSAGGLLLSPTRRMQWMVLLVSGLLGCGVGSALLVTKAGDMNTPAAIVLAAETIGRSGPGDDFLQVFTLHEGTKVVLERNEGPWGLVRLPNGIGGWIVLDAMGMI